MYIILQISRPNERDDTDLIQNTLNIKGDAELRFITTENLCIKTIRSQSGDGEIAVSYFPRPASVHVLHRLDTLGHRLRGATDRVRHVEVF